MTERCTSYEEIYLTEDEISAELLADTLSDVPDDADSDSENDSDSSIIGNRQNKIVHPLLSYSDNEQSANESDNDNETLDSAVSTWVKTDKTPNLGPFTRNPGVKNVLEVVLHTPAWPKFSPFPSTASFRRDFGHIARPI